MVRVYGKEPFGLWPREPRVLVPPLIGGNGPSVAGCRPNHLRRHLDERPVTLLALPQRLLAALSLLDVDTGSEPLDDVSKSVTQGDLVMEHPAEFAVSPPHAGFVQEGLPAGQCRAPRV